jgi:hypothetical protein
MSGNALRRQIIEGDVVDNLRRALSAKTQAAAPAKELPRPLSTNLSVVDEALRGGLPRGKLIEIAGGAGKMAFALLALAAATQRGELCAFVDTEDALDVQSAARIGVVLERLLWVRPATNTQLNRDNAKPADSNADSALKSVDLLLGAGGFSLIVMYIGQSGRGRGWRAASVWPRLGQRCEKANTALLVATDEPLAGSFAAATLRCEPGEAVWERAPGGRLVLQGQRAAIEVVRSRLGSPGDSAPLALKKHAR